MRCEGLLLDVYGTVLHDDDEVLAPICARVASLTGVEAGVVAEQWWHRFGEAAAAAHGPAFRRQRDLARETLAATAEALGSPPAALEAGPLVDQLRSFWRSPPAFEDATRFLRDVSVPVCLVSDIDTDDLLAALDLHALEVEAVVTSEDARATKPRPEPFELGLRALGLRADQVLHVGDSLSSDVAGAAALGIRTVWVDRRGRDLPEVARPTHTVAHLGELLRLLQACRARALPRGAGGEQ